MFNSMLRKYPLCSKLKFKFVAYFFSHSIYPEKIRDRAIIRVSKWEVHRELNEAAMHCEVRGRNFMIFMNDQKTTESECLSCKTAQTKIFVFSKLQRMLHFQFCTLICVAIACVSLLLAEQHIIRAYSKHL